MIRAMPTDPELLGFEQAQLLAIIAAARDSAELAVLITVADTDPPQNSFLSPGVQQLLG